jgi:hypothetical protein
MEISVDKINWIPDTKENRMSLEYPWKVLVKFENVETINRLTELSEFLKFPPQLTAMVEINRTPPVNIMEYSFDQKECAQQFLDTVQDWIYNPDRYPGILSATGEGFDDSANSI